ncbi:MAG: Smr/MutS family protein [Thermodesulfobacteriota bacterium]
MERRRTNMNARRLLARRGLEPGPLFHRPFTLLKIVVCDDKKPGAIAGLEPAPAFPAENDHELFRSAMADVTPLDRRNRRLSRPRGLKPRMSPVFYSEDLAVKAHLEDLVAGRVQFDVMDSDEYLEGRVRGVKPFLLEKLRAGRFSVQAHLDLHGLTVREAETAVASFINRAVALKHRCVLLIHGRGLNSKDNIPVLKKRLETLLLSSPVRRHILAFTSARPHDGGAGASYVLLRSK